MTITLAPLLEGVSRNDLARRSAAITAHYRAGRGSEHAVKDRLDALAYAAARMPATRAAVAEAFARLREVAPDLAPRSLLDLGCGCGAASLAARHAFPLLGRLTLIDRNAAMLALARELLGEETDIAALSLDLRRLADAPRADLVVMAYVLVEMETSEATALALEAFTQTSEALVLVEPGTPEGFARLRDAREALVGSGAQIAAPCPHHLACPIKPPDWRHFSVRVQRSRDHLTVKGAEVPYEDEPFIYLAATRAPIGDRAPRVIARPRRDRSGVTMKLCTPAGEAVERFTPTRDKATIRALRRVEEGDRWPF